MLRGPAFFFFWICMSRIALCALFWSLAVSLMEPLSGVLFSACSICCFSLSLSLSCSRYASIDRYTVSRS
jgi:hypothetical protein